MQRGNSDSALQLYEALVKRHGTERVPPATCALLIRDLVQRGDRAERALLLYDQARKQGMPRDLSTFSAAIFACAQRRQLYARTFDLLQEMDAWECGPVPMHVYEHLLFACAKVGDFETARGIWRHLLEKSAPVTESNARGLFRISAQAMANLLWVLASVETDETKKSVWRQVCYPDAIRKEVLEMAQSVVQMARQRGVLQEKHLGALLAVCANLKFPQEAEHVFYSLYPQEGFQRHPQAFESMLNLCDSLENYQGAVRIKALADELKVTPRLSYAAWQSLVRCAAHVRQLKHAVELMEEMYSYGHRPRPSGFRLLHLRLFEEELFALHERFKKLCPVHTPEELKVIEKLGYEPRPVESWKVRSVKVQDMFDHLYGGLPKNQRPRLVDQETRNKLNPQKFYDWFAESFEKEREAIGRKLRMLEF